MPDRDAKCIPAKENALDDHVNCVLVKCQIAKPAVRCCGRLFLEKWFCMQINKKIVRFEWNITIAKEWN